jgi:predicted transcriptional regulator
MAEVYSKNVKGELVISDTIPVQKIRTLQVLKASLADSEARLVIKKAEVVGLESEIAGLKALIVEAGKLGVV